MMIEEELTQIKYYLFEHFTDFTYKPTDDRFFYLMAIQFPELDLLTELKKFHVWTMDSSAPIRYPKIRFQNWLIKSQKFSKNKF